MKRLETTHHKFQRRLLGILWKNKMNINEATKSDDIGKKTNLRKLEDVGLLKNED